MNRKSLLTKSFQLALILLIACFSISVFGQTKDKKSKDLKDKEANTPGSTRVDIIVRSSVDWTTTQTGAVTSNNGQIKKSFTNFKRLRVINIPLNAINGLANRSDFVYFTLDRDLQKTGHLTSTTGTDIAMATGGAVTYDGTGIGIAVIDSGIDTLHVAPSTLSNALRVVASVDFTGEGRTDDPFGHGTHVASTAPQRKSFQRCLPRSCFKRQHRQFAGSEFVRFRLLVKFAFST